jgi:hypothetical protein
MSNLIKAEDKASPQQQSYDLNPHALDFFNVTEGYVADDTHHGTVGAFSYEALRSLARMPIISSIIQTRVNQIAEFARPQPDRYSAGFVIRLRDANQEMQDHHRDQIRALTEWLTSCGDSDVIGWTTFENFLRAVTRDSLTFDQCCFEIIYDDYKPVAFKPVDASTIRRASITRAEKQKGRRDPEATAYVQVIEGKVVAEFDNSEMAFGVRRPRTELNSNGYGYPELEEVAPTVMDMVRAKAYNSANFTHGLHLSGILAVKSKMSPALFRAFRREFYSMLQGSNGAKKTPILQLDPESKEEIQSVNLSNSNSDMEYSQWLNFLIKETCSIFQMDPAELGYLYGAEGQTSSLNVGGTGDRITFSKEKGLRPLLRALESWVNRWIIYPMAPHLELSFVGLDAQTEEKRLETMSKRVKSHLTINEARAMFDLEPLDNPIADMILDASYINTASQYLEDDSEVEIEEEF